MCNGQLKLKPMNFSSQEINFETMDPENESKQKEGVTLSDQSAVDEDPQISENAENVSLQGRDSDEEIPANIPQDNQDIADHDVEYKNSIIAESHPEDEFSSSEDGNDTIDSDTDEEEPRLKYNRLQGISEALSKDAVSCFAVSDRFLAVGTHMGHVHIMDLLGTQIKQFSSHSASVNQVSIDTNGEYVASASDDGNVAIYGLYTTDIQTTFFKRPIKAVNLEPEYSKKTSRQFVSGGLAESLILTGKGWFGNSNVVLHSGEGPILTVSWRGNYIVWSNEQGVHVYDVSLSQKFAKIERPPNSPRADLFKCSISWISDTSFLIGWADSVKKIEIKNRPKHDMASGHPPKMAEVVCQFRTEYIVSGIAPVDSGILLLGFNADLSSFKDVDTYDVPVSTTRRKSEPPEIHIVDLNGEIVSSDVLSLTGYEHYQANDYRLEFSPSLIPTETTYYIVSPKDIVVAKPRDLDDHIEWLVERKKYGKALKAAENADLSSNVKVKVGTIIEIGQKHISALLSEGNFEEAASECPKILRQDADLWEQWVFSFAEAGQLDTLYPYLKTDKPRLATTVYELFLVHFLNTNPEKLLEVVRVWPTEVYTIRNVIAAVDAVYQRDISNQHLLETLHELYLRNRQYDEALKCGLNLRKPDTLDLVESHNLFSVLQKNLILLFDYASDMIQSFGDKDQFTKSLSSEQENLFCVVLQTRAMAQSKAVRIISENPDLIPPPVVVDALKTVPRYLHIYLDSLSANENFDSSIYHNLQVELYADHDRPGLMNFLRQSNSYDLTKAYKLTEERDFVPEMVHLLGKMGNNRRALMLIIERLNDVEQAIEFAKRQDDNDLWDEFLKYAMDKAPFIVGLLENAGTHINPLSIVQKIPKGLQIPGLRQALIKILSDSTVQMSLREGCERILVGDTWENLLNLTKSQKSAILVEPEISCIICENTFQSQEESSLVLFFCKHTFHRSCLQVELPEIQNAEEEQGDHGLAPIGMVRSRSSSFVHRGRGSSLESRIPPSNMNKSGIDPSRTQLKCPICRSDSKRKDQLITLR